MQAHRMVGDYACVSALLAWSSVWMTWWLPVS